MNAQSSMLVILALILRSALPNYADAKIASGGLGAAEIFITSPALNGADPGRIYSDRLYDGRSRQFGRRFPIGDSLDADYRAVHDSIMSVFGVSSLESFTLHAEIFRFVYSMQSMLDSVKLDRAPDQEYADHLRYILATYYTGDSVTVDMVDPQSGDTVAVNIRTFYHALRDNGSKRWIELDGHFETKIWFGKWCRRQDHVKLDLYVRRFMANDSGVRELVNVITLDIHIPFTTASDIRIAHNAIPRKKIFLK